MRSQVGTDSSLLWMQKAFTYFSGLKIQKWAKVFLRTNSSTNGITNYMETRNSIKDERIPSYVCILVQILTLKFLQVSFL